jgi:hypothetical protein
MRGALLNPRFGKAPLINVASYLSGTLVDPDEGQLGLI